MEDIVTRGQAQRTWDSCLRDAQSKKTRRLDFSVMTCLGVPVHAVKYLPTKVASRNMNIILVFIGANDFSLW